MLGEDYVFLSVRTSVWGLGWSCQESGCIEFCLQLAFGSSFVLLPGAMGSCGSPACFTFHFI